MKRLTLELGELDWTDERFRTSPPTSLVKLTASLKIIGLLHPPFVTSDKGRWVIVSGWKRLLACRSLALSPVEVVDTGEPDALKNFLLGFLENAASRPVGLVETAEILARLAAFGEDRDTIRREFMPLLDLPQNAEVLEDYLSLAGFSPEIKRGLEAGFVTFPVARALAAFAPADRAALFPHLLPLGQNKQKEILENLREICLRDGATAVSVLDSPEISDILGSGNLPQIQRSERLRQALLKLRFPAYSRRRSEFEAAVKDLGLPSEVCLEPAAFFEKNEATVTMRIRSAAAFRAVLARLGDLASDEEFGRVFFWMT